MFCGDLYIYSVVVTKVGREVARLMKEESRLIGEPNDVSVETRKGLQLYGSCDLYVFCWYVCRLFVMNYGAVSTNQDDPFCFQRILKFLTRAQKNAINKILQAQGCDIHKCST